MNTKRLTVCIFFAILHIIDLKTFFSFIPEDNLEGLVFKL